MRMRKPLALLLSGLMIATAMSFMAQPHRASAQTAEVAVLLPDSKSSVRWETADRPFLAAAFKAAGVTYSIVNAEGDAATQATQADQAITNGAKVVLLVDLDAGSGAAIIAKVHDAGGKVIDYDRLTTSGPGADFYVSFDNTAVGVLQGQGLVAAIKAAGTKNPRIAELNGSPTDNNATLFKNGYDSILQPLYNDKASGWTKVADQSVPAWDNTQALTIFEQMLTATNNGIDGVAAANDGLAQAVITALENSKLPYIPVTGQDATLGGIQNILAGKQSMTVYKAIKAEANAAAALAVGLIKGVDVRALVTATTNNKTNDVPSVLLVPVAVTKANIATTVIADGFQKWSDICVGAFAKFCPPDAMTSGSATMVATTAP